MKFHRITPVERQLFQPGIVAIEKIAKYPLGNDFFQIDHGLDYFAFFDRLGKVNYYVMHDNYTVGAVGAGILRQIPYQQGETFQSAWYLCDLKVHPNYQRRNLSLRILSQAIIDGIRECNCGYTISMNPGDGTFEVIPGYTHMFCVPFNDKLALSLADKAIYPGTSASVLSHGMEDSDWRFILTSDI